MPPSLEILAFKDLYRSLPTPRILWFSATQSMDKTVQAQELPSDPLEHHWVLAES